ncbi:MAG TPA: 4-hydroxythreonine-4-phosphate dehydrogenase PdxA [bacterium]|nr:4-hydroxythreonine-4-phosphate dehydrogenase PdxA [bacterium]
MGDPQGIGPEVVRKALASKAVKSACDVLLFGDTSYYDFQRAKKLTPAQCGKLSGYYIQEAARSALYGRIDAVATAPISKERLNLGGYPYPGHTEFLAHLSRVDDVRMMMAGPKLKTVLATIHEPLASVAKKLSVAGIAKTIEITHDSMARWFGIKKPRIAVAALNPHAGESGMFGAEEKKIILPAVKKTKERGWNVSGPFPADTVYHRAVKGEFDCVVSMYHDQGLIPLKLLHFDEAVNITLGLPFIRTSVDHGTAFDIAGKNLADASSMIAAILTAAEMARGYW